MIKEVADKIKGLINRGGSRVKVPTVLQMEATECGAASLAMILARNGLWLPLEKLRQMCGVNRDGSNARNILKAARSLGCEAKAYSWPVEKIILRNIYPLIIHWEFNHFVVLEGIKGGIAYLNDPALGRRTVPIKDFTTSYTGVCLKIIPTAAFKPSGQRYSVVKAVAKKLLQDKWAMLFVMIIGLCMIVPGLAMPVISQIFIDDVLTNKHPDWAEKLYFALIGAIIINCLMVYLRSYILTTWQKKLTLADSTSFFWHLIRLPIQFFQQRHSAEVASRISFNEGVAGVLSGSAATSVLDFFVALFYLLLLFQYSVPLTLIGLFFSLINLLVLALTRRKMTDLTMRMQQDKGKEYGTLMNGLLMMESIKANGGESDFFTKWAGYRAKTIVAGQTIKLFNINANLLPNLLAGINGALIMTIGGFSIMDGVMTAGIFMAFQSLMGNFQAPFNNLLGLGTTLQGTEMQMQRLDDVRRYDVDSLNYPDEKQKITFKGSRLSGELELRNISFGYSPLDPPLLEDFNLHIKPGRWVAVVGSSGSGKSTMAKIVTGLYEQWSGDVLFDGVNRREIPRAVIVHSVSSVDQDIFQITGTIADNIALFDNSMKRSDIIQAARDACIHEDIVAIKGGYDSEVAEGGRNFSGGQRQRIEIARALAVNPSLLILDEATSALDPIVEQQILENIRRRGCSCFIVAHRLSTIRDCDEIIVLEKGKVAERGTHREMIRHDGPYRRLIEDRNQ